MAEYYLSEFESAKNRFHARFRILSPWAPELIAMKHGLRSAIMLHIPPGENLESELSWVQTLCHEKGFYQLAKDTYPRGMDVVISNTPIGSELLKDEEKLGGLFGYPACCIQKFTELTRAHRYSPLINDVADLVAQGNRFDFKMNIFLQGSPFHLFKHFPCSLRCEETLSFAERLLDAIETENPELHESILRFNKVPVLYTDICGTAILFRGRMEGGCIRYDELYADVNLSDILQFSRRNTAADARLFDDILDSLSTGNEVMLSADALTISGDPLRHQSRTFKSGRLFWKLLSFE